MNSKNGNFLFNRLSRENISPLVNVRIGETKIGQQIATGEPTNSTRFILLGIEESIGPQANYGLTGAENGFSSFLPRFLNMQSNRFLNGSEICLLGSIKHVHDCHSIEEARELVSELDQFVYDILTHFSDANLIPIVIGGGHNNAYPLIKSISSMQNKALQIVNLDPHADCRPTEGRHSGNSFSYGIEAGYITKYAVFGLHKAYNSESILTFLEENACTYTFFDDYIEQSGQFEQDIANFIAENTEKLTGIEIDMDSIRNMPSSAFTPSGWPLEKARYFVKKMAELPVAYLHLPEAAPSGETDSIITGKALAYLVYDFISKIISG